MNAPDTIYAEISRQRWASGEHQEVTTVTVPETIYRDAYEFMHHLDKVTYPLPVPEREYRMWGVVVKSA